MQDANSYYQIENTDNYGSREISKYVNGVKVDSALFTNEYTQGVNYTVSIAFSPNVTTVEAFGETLTMNSDNTAITVNSFSVETLQQDAFYDNIVYSIASTSFIQISTPLTNHIQSDENLTVEVFTNTLEVGWGVKFVLDEGSVNEQVIMDMAPPYEVIFRNITRGEHRIDCYIIDALQNEQVGEDHHTSAVNVAIGDIYVAIGDSITSGYGDDLASDDISLDGRNTGGGYTPLLNDHLTSIKGYPHTVINEGLDSETTQEGLSRLPSVLAKYPEASRFLILYGTNDSPTWASLESGKGLYVGDEGYDGTYKDYMQQMIDLINSAEKKAVVAKIPVVLGFTSTSGDYALPITGDEYRNVKTRDFNEVIDELVADTRNNILVIPPDLYLYFIDNYTNEYFDNLHPNGLGYRSMADLWSTALIP